MKAMKVLSVLVFFLSSLGAQAQANCISHGQLLVTSTTCPCTGSQTQLIKCQNNGQGSGCYDFAFQNFLWFNL